MPQILSLLGVLAFVLAVVAVVGHGLWVLAAWFVSSLTESTRPAANRTRECPRCFTPLKLGGPVECTVCHWPAPVRGRLTLSGLDAIARRVEQLEQNGLLDAQARRRLLETVAIERERVELLAATVPQPARSLPAEDERAPNVAGGPSSPLTAADAVESTRRTVADAAALQPSGPLHRPAEVGARVEQYAARRAAAVAIEHAQSPPVTPPPKREAISKLLAAFMEEKNIRWGELVGGLLIICCSIALVISFWAKIAARPFLKFFLFGGVTAALFAAGLYTERRWKLRTTSHGILIIATLLVPLNFLAIAAFTHESPPTDAVAIGGELISIGLFAALIWAAGRIFLPNAPLLVVISTMIPSVMQLLTRRFVDVDAPLWTLYAVAAVPIANYLAVAAIYVARLFKVEAPARQDADRLFIYFGIATYAMLLPLALLLYKTQAIGPTLQQLAPFVTLLCLPALSSGLWFWRRVRSPDLVGERTAGIGIGVLGAGAMVAAIVLAWPQPVFLLPVALLTAAAFAAIAIVFAIPAAHAVAGASFALAWLVTFFLVQGDVTWKIAHAAPLVSVLLSAASGTGLVPLAGLFAVAAVLLQRGNRALDALWYFGLAACTALASLALVTWFGFGQRGDPHGATWVYAVYAAGSIITVARSNLRWLGWTASGLALLTIVQALVFRWTPSLAPLHVWGVALLTHASFAAVLSAGLRMLWGGERSGPTDALGRSALATSSAAAALLAAAAPGVGADQTTPLAFWLSAVWLALAWMANWPQVFTAFQAALFVSVFSCVTAVLADRAWYAAADRPWLDPWFWQVQGIAMAAVCLMWTGLRSAVRHTHRLAHGDDAARGDTWLTTANRFLNPPWPAVDRVCQVLCVVLLLFLATYAAVPGVSQELAPRAHLAETGSAPRIVPAIGSFEIPAIPHEHAANIGSWLLLAATVAVLVAGLWEGHVAARVVGILLALGTACLLIAAQFEGSVSVASALRWCMAAFFLVASLPLWLTQHVRTLAQRWSVPLHRDDMTDVSPASAYRAVLFSVAALPYLAMAVYVGIASVGRAGVHPSVSPLLPWLASVLAVAGVIALGLRQVAAGQQTEIGSRTRLHSWAESASTALFVLGLAPLVVAVLFDVAAAIKQHPIIGPEPGSFFHNVGWAVSYAVPVLVMAAALVIHALREQSSRIAFAAGLVFHLGATAGFMLLLPQLGRGLDARAWVNVAQVNVLVAAFYAVVWNAILSWHRRRTGDANNGSVPTLLEAQLSLSMGLSAFAIIPAAVWLVAAPVPTAWVVEAGGWMGWLAAILTVAAAAWTAHNAGGTPLSAATCTSLIGLPLVALTAARWDTGNWLAYHTLLVTSAAGAWGMTLLPLLFRRDGRIRTAAWSAAAAMGGIATFLALRALAGDPQAPWWTIGTLLAMSGLSVTLAVATARHAFLYPAAVLLNLAGSIWWIDSGYQLTSSLGFAALVDFVHFNVIVAAVPVLLWVTSELRWIRPRLGDTARAFRPGVHHVASTLSVVGLVLMLILGLASNVHGGSLGESPVLAWLALAATLAAAIACLWDRPSQVSLARLYFVALAAAGQILNVMDLSGQQFWWMLTMVLAAFSLATSYAWSRRRELRAFAKRVGVPVDTTQPLAEGIGLAWLVPANSLVAAAVTTLAFWMILTLDNLTERMIAAYAILAQTAAIGLLARGAVRSSLQYASLVLGVLFAVAFGWAWLPVNLDSPLLHRSVVLAVALVATTVVYGFGLVKPFRRENEWTIAATRLVPLLVVGLTITILFVLAAEAVSYAQAGQVPIFWYEILAVSLALGALCLAALAAAVLPGRDPLGLSDRGKQAYVYAAEVALALLCVHIRLTMPWLFQGWFVRYWPLVAMAIAFVGVGLGEGLARRRASILSEPLQTTGALLPVLPMLGFWIVPGEVNYSLLLLTVGVLYAALSALRQSFLYGVLAALAANGSLWYLLHRADGLALAEHPQLWLIPPALCVLVAAYLNRDQLSKEQMTAIRYMSAIVIYVSSTAEIFINGVADAPWLPLVLAAISIAGIFAGILLRVRAFVYLGTSFLVVALFSIIWHAAVELGYAWLWWVCGIIAGMCIITLFAIFEKKRDDMLRIVDRLRAWEP
jgi:hypothetical protein